MKSSEVTDTVSPAAGFHPGRLAADDQGVWCEAGRFPFLVHVDPATNALAGTVDLASALGWQEPRQVHDLAAGAGALWLAVSDAVVRVDPTTHEVSAVIPVPPQGMEGHQTAGSLTVDEHGVWVAGAFQDVIRRIDPAVNAITHEVPVRRSLRWPLVAYGSIWMLDALDGPICRLDPATGKTLAEIDTGGRPIPPMRAAGGSVLLLVGNQQWELGSRLVRIDPETNTVAPMSERRPNHWYASRDALWVVDPKKPQLTRLDPRSGDVVAVIDLRAHWTWLFADTGADLWTSGVTFGRDPERRSLLRIDTSRNEVAAIIDLDDVEIPEHLLPKPPPRLGHEEFAQRVLVAVREDAFGGGYTVDPRTGEISSVPFHDGIGFEEVTLEASEQDAIVVLLFRSADHPGCLFGYRADVPYDPAAPSHDPEEEAMHLTLPLSEQLHYGFLPQECDPDDNGITWV